MVVLGQLQFLSIGMRWWFGTVTVLEYWNEMVVLGQLQFLSIGMRWWFWDSYSS